MLGRGSAENGKRAGCRKDCVLEMLKHGDKMEITAIKLIWAMKCVLQLLLSEKFLSYIPGKGTEIFTNMVYSGRSANSIQFECEC